MEVAAKDQAVNGEDKTEGKKQATNNWHNHKLTRQTAVLGTTEIG